MSKRNLIRLPLFTAWRMLANARLWLWRSTLLKWQVMENRQYFCASVVAGLCQQSSMGPVSPSCKSEWFGGFSTGSKGFGAALSTPSQSPPCNQNSKILIGNMNLDLMTARMSLGYSFCSDLVIHLALYPILKYRVNEKHQWYVAIIDKHNWNSQCLRHLEGLLWGPWLRRCWASWFLMERRT